MKHTRPTQAQRILDYLNDFGSITQAQAIHDLGVMRLASRISELRKRGHKIESEWVPVVNRWGEPCKIKRYIMNKEA